MQLQNIIKLVEVVNTQLAEMDTSIIQGDIESHIQALLADELDWCKGKENLYTNNHIKKI